MKDMADIEAGVTLSSRANIERFQDRSSQLVASLEIEMVRARRYERPLSLISLSTRSEHSGKSDGKGFRQLNMEKRMRRLGPVILRLPDFWGRIDRHGFLIVLTETDQAGADAAIQRLVASEPFQQLLQDERGRHEVLLFATQLGPQMQSLAEFVEATRSRLVWSSTPALIGS